ncbi:MAG: hypothetical protein ACI8QZ_000129 [Chlamydiales bacterium]|jgi:hypothetical protein
MHAPSAPHDHATHDHDDGHEGELFPRVLTAKLVGEREEQRLRREARQVWMVGAGLAILALGLPLSRVLVGAPSLSPLPHAAIDFLGELTGAPRERISFALSAMLLGLSIPLIASTLRAVGFIQQALLPATLIAALSPLAWLGATSATDFFLGVVACAWLLRELFARSSPVRLLIAYGVGILLHVDMVLLLPALVLGSAAGTGEPGAPARPARALMTGLGAVAILALTRIAGGLAGNAPWLLGTGMVQLDAPSIPRALLILGGLGIGLWGLVAPWTRAAEEVSRPPAWCILFLALPLPTLLFDGASMGSWLVPIAALGLADLVQRGKNDHGNLQRGLVLLIVQVLLTVGLAWRWEAQDPQRAWRKAARMQLEPGDLIVSDEPLHLHLLVERWGLEACPSTATDLPQRVAAARAAERRVVLDASPSTPMPAALTGTPLVHLTEAEPARP